VTTPHIPVNVKKMTGHASGHLLLLIIIDDAPFRKKRCMQIWMFRQIMLSLQGDWAIPTPIMILSLI
jgi:hypothetical protein